MDMMNDTGNIKVLRLDDKVQLFGQYLMQHFPFVCPPLELLCLAEVEGDFQKGFAQRRVVKQRHKVNQNRPIWAFQVISSTVLYHVLQP